MHTSEEHKLETKSKDIFTELEDSTKPSEKQSALEKLYSECCLTRFMFKTLAGAFKVGETEEDITISHNFSPMIRVRSLKN